MADADPCSPPNPGKTTEELADIPGSYPTRDHVDRPTPTPPQAEPTASIISDSEPEGRTHLEGVKSSSLSRTLSPTWEEFVMAQGHWSVSWSRLATDNVPTTSINTKSKFFPHNSLAIEHAIDEATAPEHPEHDGGTERLLKPFPKASAKLLRCQEQVKRHAKVVKEHLRHEEEAKWEEDDRWMEIVSRLGNKSASDGEGNDAPNGGHIQALISSTPHPRAKMPRLVHMNATTVEGKWPKVDVNEVRRELAAKEKQPSARRAPERPAETTDIEANDKGDNDNEEYILPEAKTRKNKKPSRERSESPECPKPKLSKPHKKPSKEKACEKLKSKGVSITDMRGYLAKNHSMRVGSETEDVDEISSDDGAGKTTVKTKSEKEQQKKPKGKKNKKRSHTSSPSSSSSSSSSSSLSESLSSSNSSGLSSLTVSLSLSSYSSSSESSRGNARSSKATCRSCKHQRELQKKAAHKYKKLKRQIKRQSRSSWKAKQPTAYNGVANFDVFKQWVFEVDFWMHDTGFKKLKAIRHVGGFLTRKAASWYMNKVMTNLREYKRMWKLYQELFEHCFPFNYKQTLRERFHKAMQGNRSIKDFMHELRLYDKRLGDLAEREVHQRLWDGVQLYIRLKWTKNGMNPEDKQMRKEETKKAKRLKSDYTRTKLTKPDKARNSRARSRSPERPRGDRREDKSKEKKPEKPEKPERPGKSSKPERKMDNAEQKLTPKEKEQYQAEGRCFKCGDIGHKSRNCPRKNKVKPSHISSSTVCLKAMDDLAKAVD
ncbi:hypothetical protein FRC11_000408 [Ceratobasidium sp. 423]|nr:hypothetical protein FRC11_000408 [Ceratobasidium sp. 423]